MNPVSESRKLGQILLEVSVMVLPTTLAAVLAVVLRRLIILIDIDSELGAVDVAGRGSIIGGESGT